MCRKKTDRIALVAALKRIQSPPDSIQGQTGHLRAGLNNEIYFQTIVDWMQDIATVTLANVGSK